MQVVQLENEKDGSHRMEIISRASNRDTAKNDLDYEITHNTISNHDIHRMHAAIDEFRTSLHETIKVYQAGDKVSFMDNLKARNKKHFYVLEQMELNPEFQKFMETGEDSRELS